VVLTSIEHNEFRSLRSQTNSVHGLKIKLAAFADRQCSIQIQQALWAGAEIKQTQTQITAGHFAVTVNIGWATNTRAEIKQN